MFHPATRRACAVLGAMILLLATSTLTAQRHDDLFRRASHTVKAWEHRLLSTARAVPLTVDAATFLSVASPSMRLSSIPIAPDRDVELDLTEFSVVASDARLQYTDEAGPHPLGPLSVRTYRGQVAGDPSSDVYLAVARRSVFGLITTGGTSYQITTDYSENPGVGLLAAFAVPTADLPDQKVTCGLKDKPFTEGELEAMAAVAADDPCPQILQTIRGAFDADYEFYVEWDGEGGQAACADYMVSLIAGESVIYERDARVAVAIGYLNIWTTAGDPYTQSAFMPIALDEAQGYWVTGEAASIPRGFVQVFSAKSWTEIVGIARGFDFVCDPINGITFQLARKLDPIGSIAVIAHELGHIMGLRHTHSCTWSPHIDECAPAESGNCFTGTTAAEGTIMSYCKQKLMKIHERQVPYLRLRVPTWSSCAVDAKKLELQKPYIAFPTVNVGEPIDTTFEIFFQNRSQADINVSSLTILGDDGNQFELISPSAPFVVPSCDSVPLHLLFKAEIEAVTQARLIIAHDAHNATIAPRPELIVNLEAYAKDDRPFFTFVTGGAEEIDFRRVRVATVRDSAFNAPRQLFMNLGAAVLRVDSTAILGPDRLEFQIKEGSGPFELVPGQKRGAVIRFAPLTAGQKRAWLVVYSNSADQPADSLLLKGNADPGAVLELRIADRVIDFGMVRSGLSYDTTFDNFFYNSGTEPLEVSATVGGAHADMFPGTNWFETLDPQAGMPLTIGFFTDTLQPWGWKEAYIIIATNTPKGLDTVKLMAKIFATAAVSGDEGENDEYFAVVPNPTSGAADIRVLPIGGEIGLEYTLTITDAAGKEMRRSTGRYTAEGIRASISAGELPEGVYFVSVATTERRRSQSVRILR